MTLPDGSPLWLCLGLALAGLVVQVWEAWTVSAMECHDFCWIQELPATSWGPQGCGCGGQAE